MENYFNYFTEIEECFRRCRNTPTLLSTLDWALIESWKEADIPLAAVLTGIERAFEKFGKRRHKYRMVNSLAYCSQEVLRAAEEAQAQRVEGGKQSPVPSEAKAPFSVEEIGIFLSRNAEAVEKASRLVQEKRQPVLSEDLAALAAALRGIKPLETTATQNWANLQELERQLTALEEKLTAALTRAASVELLTQFRGEVERGLVPYRQKMTAGQIESLERQFLKKRLLEHYQIPRLSLFYM